MKKTKDLIMNQSFKMIVKEESIYINQFNRINILENNHIFFTTSHKKIHIYGQELKMKKLVEKEVLFTGMIEKIEVQDE